MTFSQTKRASLRYKDDLGILKSFGKAYWQMQVHITHQAYAMIDFLLQARFGKKGLDIYDF
jgi:hypothetical protein